MIPYPIREHGADRPDCVAPLGRCAAAARYAAGRAIDLLLDEAEAVGQLGVVLDLLLAVVVQVLAGLAEREQPLLFTQLAYSGEVIVLSNASTQNW